MIECTMYIRGLSTPRLKLLEGENSSTPLQKYMEIIVRGLESQATLYINGIPLNKWASRNARLGNVKRVEIRLRVMKNDSKRLNSKIVGGQTTN